MSLSFSWGFTPKLEERSATKPSSQEASIANTTFQPSQPVATIPTRNKRRHADDDDLNSSPSRPPVHRGIKKPTDKFRVGKKEEHHKRSRAHIARILGQPLPTQRVVEVLDKSQLEHLVGQLCTLHPELALDISRMAPKPAVSAAIAIMEKKVDAIEQALPYKVDTGSEYAYLRVKPLIEDFLSALSDYTLSFLPPVEPVPATSLEFLDSATTLLHKLPQFDKMANNYFRDLAYEQLAHTWCMCLREFLANSNGGLLVLANNNWEAKIKRHNDMSRGKMESVVEMYKQEMKWFTEENNLKEGNFSAHNSPCGLKNSALGPY